MASKESQQADDSGLYRDVGAFQMVRVSGAVPAFVRGADDGAHLAQGAAYAREHPLPLDGVLAHEGPFVRVERTRLVDDLLGHCDLAHVVKAGRVFGAAPLPVVEVQLIGHRYCQRDNTLTVSSGVLVVLLDQISQQDRRAEVCVPELECLLEASTAFPRKERQQAQEREKRQKEEVLVGRGDSRHEGDRESSPSTAQIQLASASWLRGGMPYSYHSRAMVAAKSNTNWASNATT